MSEAQSTSRQDRATLRQRVGTSLLNDRFSIVGAILLVAFISQILKFTLPELDFWGIPVALLAIWLLSWLKGVGWSDIGLTRPESWSKTIRMAIVAMLIVQGIGFLQGTIQFILREYFSIVSTPADLSTYEEAMSPLQLLRWIVIAWTTAGLGEEVIYRGFYMKQVARVFDEQKRSSWVIGLVVSSLGFGLAHFRQGAAGMVGTALLGAVYGIFYLRSGRNLWVPFIAHGLTGTTSFIFIYLSQLQ
jgi:membrane protease YdiL (CAAX protease family)